MNNSLWRDQIIQSRMNALSAIDLHRARVMRWRRAGTLVEFLTIAVPITYFVPKILASQTQWESALESTWEILAALLLIMTILKSVYRWRDKEIRHSIASRINEDVSREARRLLDSDDLSAGQHEQFLKRVSMANNEDRDLLLGVSADEEKRAYRFALKHANPNMSTLCPKCGADPWIFVPGDCAACGGTFTILRRLSVSEPSKERE